MQAKVQNNKYDDMPELKELLLSYENVVHDIKGPLTIIYTYIQILESNKKLPKDAVTQISAVKRNCFKLIKLITDLNDSAKLFSGCLLPTLNNTNVVELVRSIIDATAVLTFNKSVEIELKCGLDEKIMATDKSLLERVLLNLLSNAIKFSKREGKVTVCFEDLGNEIRIIVKDNGLGIPKEDLSRIFDRYHTSDSMRGRGIGLNIVKEIVELLGGDIRAESILSKGTSMIVTLPVFLIDEQKERKFFYDDFYLDNMVQIELAEEYYSI